VQVKYVCISLFIMSYLIHVLHSVWGTILVYPHIFSCCLEKFLQILFGDDRKSTSGCWFSVLVNSKPFVWICLILSHMLVFVHLFSSSMFLLFFCLLFQHNFFLKKKNLGRRCGNFIHFLLIAFQILHVFLLDTSNHCALIEYAYIWLRIYN
jgi:hypothetical protein